ncbi:MAG: hypothetical protein K8R74_10990 [Bacteroidales bacterium]|nr:hypothetical protein [Bacteroidales bacterium]
MPSKVSLSEVSIPDLIRNPCYILTSWIPACLSATDIHRKILRLHLSSIPQTAALKANAKEVVRRIEAFTSATSKIIVSLV